MFGVVEYDEFVWVGLAFGLGGESLVPVGFAGLDCGVVAL